MITFFFHVGLYSYLQVLSLCYLTFSTIMVVYYRVACVAGDGTFSFNEFVEIVCNMGGHGDRSREDEERELRDAFKVCSYGCT